MFFKHTMKLNRDTFFSKYNCQGGAPTSCPDYRNFFLHAILNQIYDTAKFLSTLRLGSFAAAIGLLLSCCSPTEPDIFVDRDVADEMVGRFPQLDKAMELILSGAAAKERNSGK